MPDDPILGDAFGNALLARLDGGDARIIIERDDGFVDADVSDYSTLVEDDALWKWIRARLGSRVLDIGAGAGRASIALQRDRVDVVALDVSPGCLDVCRRRGVTNTFEGTITRLAATTPTPFDSLLALGNNLGLMGSRATALEFFAAARALSTPDARLVGTMLDPYRTTNPVHLAYHERNRAAGRASGNVRLRVRHQNVASDWFDLLWVSPDELSEIAHEHGWELVATEPAGIIYGAELRPG